MAKGIIDELVGQEAYTQLDKLNKELEKNAKTMQNLMDKAAAFQKQLESTESMTKLIELMKKVQGLIDSTNATERERYRILNQRNILEARSRQAQTQEAKELEKLRQQLADYNRQQRNSIRDRKSVV